MRRLLHLVVACMFAVPVVFGGQSPDPRNIVNGMTIPDESYADQPYVVKTDDGAWLTVITTGPGHEGAGGQHVISLRSTDRGKTWEKPVDVEPAQGPEASYAVLLKVPGGRVYVFYNHNTDNIRQVIGDNPPYKDGVVKRVDSLGHFVFKYSDDHGRTWSATRYEIPQRNFEIDRKNVYGGKTKFFWNVGKAFTLKNAGYVPLHKVGGFGEGFFTSSEGVLLKSDNILNEHDPEKIRWETLPKGEIGLRTPAGGGPVAEEQSFTVLSDGSIFVVYRTIDGHPAFSYSRDAGQTWDPPQYMKFANGRLMKHPRAANFVWRCENGKYLYWFHNHGGRFIREHPRRRTIAYEDRNPVWLSGGLEVDTPKGKIIQWSEPEIVLYDDDPIVRMSYPDLVEDGGEYFLTETQKDIARTHRIDRSLLEGMWQQTQSKGVANGGLLMQVPAAADQKVPVSVPAPALPLFLKRSTRGDYSADRLATGVSFDLWLELKSSAAGQMLLDNRTPDGRGVLLQTAENGTVELVMNDGRTENRWRSDPGTISVDKKHHVAVIIDGGPAIITFVVDGVLNDGGDARQFGWGRFSPHFQSLNGDTTFRIGQDRVLAARLYGRAIRTSEAISSFRHGI